MQSIDSFRERLPFHRNVIAEFNRRVFVSARAPNFAIRNEAAPNFSPVHQWAVVFDRDIRQRNALFGLGSLADIRPSSNRFARKRFRGARLWRNK